jgi:inosose dehydratase
MTQLKLALNADTTPLAVSDVLVFKSLEERAREAAAAGFPAVNVDRSEPGLTPEKASAILERHGLEVASGFFHGQFHDPALRDALLREARLQAEFSKAIGQSCLFVSAFVSPPERSAIAGSIRPDDETSLDESQFKIMARILEEIARMWLDYGVSMCFHPHAATYVEAPWEIERLLAMTDAELVRFGPDTGHLLLGGAEPIDLIERHFERVHALHIKDARLQVIERARREGLDYRQTCALGVWTEIGSGDIDFPRLFRLLKDRDWSGWVIVETDHTELPTALESSLRSRNHLREAFGI